MESIVTTIITKWGLVGMLVAGAAWILWDHYKGSKGSNTPQAVEAGFQYITDVIDRLNSIYSELMPIKSSVESLEERIDQLETMIKEQSHPTYDEEAERIVHTQKISNLIYSAIKSNMGDIGADHLFVGVLHNGAHSIHGLPFMKYDIIAEHFDVMSNPHDYDLYSRYKGTDIMIHNMLPQALHQQGVLQFDETNIDLLQKLDALLYNKLVSRNIRELCLKVLVGDKNVPVGFFGAYSFDKQPNIESFRNCGDLIEDILNEN